MRDDFWVALTRFMTALRIEILQGHNAALVDLFDTIHARKVLTAFGKAYGHLPQDDGALTRDQDTFLTQTIEGLAQEGRLIPIRLALFADMVRGRPWTPATLKEVGGTQGIGVAFLEETFSSAAPEEPPEGRPGRAQSLAPRERHRHQGTHAARTTTWPRPRDTPRAGMSWTNCCGTSIRTSA